MAARLFVERGTNVRGVRPQTLRVRSRRLLEGIDRSDWQLNVVLVSSREMRRINRAHRGIDASTDVLSFPMDAVGEGPPGPSRILGDVVINADAARRQARDPGGWARQHADRPAEQWNAMAEATLLLIHGVLHLCGHLHDSVADARSMRAEERRLLDLLTPSGRR